MLSPRGVASSRRLRVWCLGNHMTRILRKWLTKTPLEIPVWRRRHLVTMSPWRWATFHSPSSRRYTWVARKV